MTSNLIICDFTWISHETYFYVYIFSKTINLRLKIWFLQIFESETCDHICILFSELKYSFSIPYVFDFCMFSTKLLTWHQKYLMDMGLIFPCKCLPDAPLPDLGFEGSEPSWPFWFAGGLRIQIYKGRLFPDWFNPKRVSLLVYPSWGYRNRFYKLPVS